jgi:hypothetical protein
MDSTNGQNDEVRGNMLFSSWMDSIWIVIHVWLMLLASLGSFFMFQKQLQQPSNADNH